VIALPLRPRHRQEPGIAAAGQLAHRGTPYGTSLSFATTTHLWPLPDPPSRKSRSATSRTGIARSIPGRALASSVSGSPRQGPGTGLPPPISTSVPGTPVIAVALRAPARRRPRPSQPPGQPNPSADRKKTRVAITARTQGTTSGRAVLGGDDATCVSPTTSRRTRERSAAALSFPADGQGQDRAERRPKKAGSAVPFPCRRWLGAAMCRRGMPCGADRRLRELVS
jgi:hypothetical protein